MLCKHEAGLRHQLALFQTYHNFVLPHASLCVPLSDAIHGTGSVKRWQQRTPAMAAGLTNRVWNLKEVLRYRVPPWPQPQGGSGPGHVDDRHPPLANGGNTPSCGVECSDDHPI
jgi:hypothetical protein